MYVQKYFAKSIQGLKEKKKKHRNERKSIQYISISQTREQRLKQLVV
jgi:hypothetical protein